MTINKTISLASKGIKAVIDIPQNTAGALISLNISDLTFPSTATASVYVAKADGHTVVNAAAVNESSVQFVTTSQMTAAAGDNEAQVQIINGEQVLHTFIFTLRVQKSIEDSSAAESTDEFTALTEALKHANGSKHLVVDGVEIIQEYGTGEASEALAATVAKNTGDITSLSEKMATKIGFLLFTKSDTLKSIYNAVKQNGTLVFSSTGDVTSIITKGNATTYGTGFFKFEHSLELCEGVVFCIGNQKAYHIRINESSVANAVEYSGTGV